MLSKCVFCRATPSLRDVRLEVKNVNRPQLSIQISSIQFCIDSYIWKFTKCLVFWCKIFIWHTCEYSLPAIPINLLQVMWVKVKVTSKLLIIALEKPNSECSSMKKTLWPVLCIRFCDIDMHSNCHCLMIITGLSSI